VRERFGCPPRRKHKRTKEAVSLNRNAAQTLDFSKLLARPGRVSHSVTADLQRWRNLVEPIFAVKGEISVFYAFFQPFQRRDSAARWPLREQSDIDFLCQGVSITYWRRYKKNERSTSARIPASDWRI